MSNAALEVESRCRDAVQILIALVQTYRHLVPVRSVSLWRDAHFDIAHAALSPLSGLDRSCCGTAFILTLPVQLPVVASRFFISLGDRSLKTLRESHGLMVRS